MLSNFILNQHKPLADYIIGFFTSKVTSPEMHESIKGECVGNMHSKIDNNVNHELCLKRDDLSVGDLLHYYFKDPNLPQDAKDIGINMQVLQMVLDRLVASTVLFKQKTIFTGNDETFYLNTGIVELLYRRNALDNVIHGFPYIAFKYRNSIFKIIVEEDFHGIGTGFLVNVEQKSVIYSLVITNEHIAKFKFRIENEEEVSLDTKETYISQKHDLAAILLTKKLDRVGLHPFGSPEVLDEVIVVGYPKIPLSPKPYQVVHRGEINGFIHDLWKTEHLIYSAMTNPGNSGGPVLNKLGLVVGVATQQMKIKDDSGEDFQPYFSAVTGADLINFLEEEVIPNLV